MKSNVILFILIHYIIHLNPGEPFAKQLRCCTERATVFGEWLPKNQKEETTSANVQASGEVHKIKKKTPSPNCTQASNWKTCLLIEKVHTFFETQSLRFEFEFYLLKFQRKLFSKNAIYFVGFLNIKTAFRCSTSQLSCLVSSARTSRRMENFLNFVIWSRIAWRRTSLRPVACRRLHRKMSKTNTRRMRIKNPQK